MTENDCVSTSSSKIHMFDRILMFRFAFSRIDADGQAYSQQQFAEYYGRDGRAHWEQSVPVVPDQLLKSEVE